MTTRSIDLLLRATDQASPVVSGALSKVEGRLKSFASRANNLLGGSLGQLLAFAGPIAGAYAFGRALKGAFDDLDELAKHARGMGVAADDLELVRYAGERTGASIAEIDKSMERFTRRLAEAAATGKGEAAPVLRDLHLSAAELIKLPLPERMKAIATALRTAGGEEERLRLGFGLFGREGQKLANTLLENSDALDAMFKRREELGGLGGDLSKIEEAGDAWHDAAIAWKGVMRETAENLAPTVKYIADFLATPAAQGISGQPGKGTAVQQASGSITRSLFALPGSRTKEELEADLAIEDKVYKAIFGKERNRSLPGLPRPVEWGAPINLSPAERQDLQERENLDRLRADRQEMWRNRHAPVRPPLVGGQPGGSAAGRLAGGVTSAIDLLSRGVGKLGDLGPELRGFKQSGIINDTAEAAQRNIDEMLAGRGRGGIPAGPAPGLQARVSHYLTGGAGRQVDPNVKTERHTGETAKILSRMEQRQRRTDERLARALERLADQADETTEVEITEVDAV